MEPRPSHPLVDRPEEPATPVEQLDPVAAELQAMRVRLFARTGSGSDLRTAKRAVEMALLLQAEVALLRRRLDQATNEPAAETNPNSDDLLPILPELDPELTTNEHLTKLIAVASRGLPRRHTVIAFPHRPSERDLGQITDNLVPELVGRYRGELPDDLVERVVRQSVTKLPDYIRANARTFFHELLRIAGDVLDELLIQSGQARRLRGGHVERLAPEEIVDSAL